MSRVIVGMSGGVDSSVTACLLKERGYEVEGVSFILWEARNRTDFTACCSLDALDGASRTAKRIGIRHSAIDVRDEFIGKVIEPFVDSYLRGSTPNPCILCNRHIKFPYLLREADKRGADFIATGHYARTVRESGSERVLLKKGADTKKDQSYVLYLLRSDELRRLVLPLGDYRKEEVRQIARSLHLEAAARPESQEICFIGNGDYCTFIETLVPSAGKPGPIMDSREGRIIGTHRGLHRYTLGQRKGLGIASLRPHYVTRIDTENNALFVGTRDEATAGEIHVTDIHWLTPVPDGLFRITVKVRSMMQDRPAMGKVTDHGVTIVFDEPQWAPAPGQSAVLYSEDCVLGGGIISAVR
jgi:tRNA-specific 2-thiouridylase